MKKITCFALSILFVFTMTTNASAQIIAPSWSYTVSHELLDNNTNASLSFGYDTLSSGNLVTKYR